MKSLLGRELVTLSPKERHTLTGALHTAIERYRVCAKTMAEEPRYALLTSVFEKQIADCLALLERIEQ